MVRKIGLAVAALVVLVAVLAAYTAARFFVFWSPTEEVAFNSGGVELAGTLIKPSGASVYPAVVIVHGSGPETRGLYRVEAKALVRGGFAVLIYDKRGTGASGGDFDTAVYRDFIADATAAVRYLASRNDIDGGRIGLVGVSEGGWFTPEIAVLTGGIAFIVNQAGPPLSWMETVLFEVRNEYLAEGIAEADLDVLLALQRRRWDYLRTAAVDPLFAQGPERDALESATSQIRATVPHADRLFPERLPDYDTDAYQRYSDYSYDPLPYLIEIDIPMLYVFGEQDENIPTALSVAFLESFREESNKDITIHMLPGVGHSLFSWAGILEALRPPGYLDFFGSWAAQHAAGG